MSTLQPFVAAAEAAWIGGVTASQVNRLVDEQLVPPTLYLRDSGSRRVARLLAAYTRFFFATDTVLQAGARKQVLADLTARVERFEDHADLFGLRISRPDVDWTVALPGRGIVIDLGGFVTEAASRAKEVDKLDQLVTVRPDTMSGAPCFIHTRVPIDFVLERLDGEESREDIQSDFPFLTDAHIEAARVFVAVNPRRGRPKSFGEANPDIKPIASGSGPAGSQCT